MLDDLRNYLQMATGVTEATTSKAKDAASGLLAHGLSLSSRAMPAPEMMSQVQELADDLMSTSRSNREMLVGMIRAEVDRAVGRMGFVREDELAALRRHVQRIEKQVDDLASSGRTSPASTRDAAPAPAPAPEPKPAPAPTPAPEPEPTPADQPADEAAPKPKRKKILVVDNPGPAS